jgi:hypothetical protein
MNSEGQVIVVSAFGRGHWAAAELVQRGLKTVLVDVSSQLGVWPSEDVEGPFGFFKNERLSPLQLERLNSEDAFYELTNGFTFWLDKGPFELKGPLTRFNLESSNLHPLVQEQLLTGANKQGRSLYRNLRFLNFDKTWLLHAAHQLAGTTYVANAKGAQEGVALPLFSSFLMRNATRPGFDKSLEWLRAKGVEVLQPPALVDLAFGSRKKIEGLELAGQRQGILRLDHLVWTLSSEETHFMNPKLGQYLFPQGPLESEWSWVRYRLQFEECFEREHIPSHVLLVQDLESPWTHENFLILQRTVVADQFDAWVRLPSVQRFNREYLTKRGDKITGILSARMPLLKPQILSYPQENYYTYSQLGAPRYPVYSLHKKKKRGLSRFHNLHLDGPEVWDHYSWNCYFNSQEQFVGRIEQWWKNKLLKEANNSRKDLES